MTGDPFTWHSNVGCRPTLNAFHGRRAGGRLYALVLVRLVFFGSGAAHALQWSKEQLPERAPEQSTHGAVQQEVDGTVNDYDHVPDVTERRVDLSLIHI